MVDRIAELEWLYVSAHTEKGRSKAQRPKPTPRPGDGDVIEADVVEDYPKPRAVPRIDSPEQLAAWLRGK